MSQPQRSTLTLEEFKRLAVDLAPSVRAVIMARAFAQLERERVDAYIRPIFEAYRFPVAAKWAESYGERVKTPRDLYLCDDETLTAEFFEDCDRAHRAHGFTGPHGHCPALTAEHLVRIAEHALIDLAAPKLGIDADRLYGDTYTKFLDILIGAAVQTGKVTVASCLKR